MQSVSISEATQTFAHLLKQVEQGEVIQIMDGERAIGRLVPVNSRSAGFDRIGFLQGQGHVPRNWKELGQDEDETRLP